MDAVPYAERKPFPHMVQDGFLSPFMADKIAGEFPPIRRRGLWTLHNDPTEKKWQLDDPKGWGPATAGFLDGLRQPPLLTMVEQITGIPDLEGDYLGGGLHLIVEGGFLSIHSDYSRHPDGRYRRVNLLIFLDDLEPQDDGDLELHGPDGVVRITPQRGRLVMFTTSATSYHGHPRPLKAPQRRSLALYFFTRTAPDDYTGDQPTTFLDEHGGRVVIGG